MQKIIEFNVKVWLDGEDLPQTVYGALTGDMELAISAAAAIALAYVGMSYLSSMEVEPNRVNLVIRVASWGLPIDLLYKYVAHTVKESLEELTVEVS